MTGAMDISNFYQHTNGDSLGGLDYSFGNGSSLDNLAGITDLIETPSPQKADIANVSTPSTDSQTAVNGTTTLTSTSPPGESDLSLGYLSWPNNLPDIITTRHL